MTDEPQTQKIYTYRLVTMNGIQVDFQSPMELSAMWIVLAGTGYFQMLDETGTPVRRIPFHAIADLKYFDPSKEIIYATPPTTARN